MLKSNLDVNVDLLNDAKFITIGHKLLDKNEKDVLWAILDRLRDLFCYFDSGLLDLNYENRDFISFKFSEWLIYSVLIHEYIKDIYKLFGYSDDFIDNYGIFDYVTIDTDSSDSDYMKYIRSIGVVHPNNTDRHINKGFQKTAETSPYMDPLGGMMAIITSPKNERDNSSILKYQNPNKDLYNPKYSFYIRLYKLNDSIETSKHIAISPLEVKKFILNSYDQFEKLHGKLIPEFNNLEYDQFGDKISHDEYFI